MESIVDRTETVSHCVRSTMSHKVLIEWISNLSSNTMLLQALATVALSLIHI